MNANDIKVLKPLLGKYLKKFHSCLGHKSSIRHLEAYVKGQLSDLPRKSIEPMALAAGLAPRTLQEFLSLLDWDHARARDRLQTLVAARHPDPLSLGVIDDTGHPKKGTKTPGVARQWCGRLGKVENCVVTVHLAFADGDDHGLLDGDLFLPEAWDQDRERCRAAGIPDTVPYRPKWRIGLECLDRAVGNGLAFRWLTFDADYGKVPEFLFGLDDRNQRYVGEVPGTFAGCFLDPAGTAMHPKYIMNLVRHSPKMYRQPWQVFRVKDTTEGPVVWEAKSVPIYVFRGWRVVKRRLIFARNLRNPAETKYFLTNAGPEAPLEVLLAVGFGRAVVEQCLEVEKNELGLSHFEVRTYRSLQRHRVLTALTDGFLAEVQATEWGKKDVPVGLPGPHRRERLNPVVLDDGREKAAVPGPTGPGDHPRPSPQRPGPGQPPEGRPSGPAPAGNLVVPAAPLHL